MTFLKKILSNLFPLVPNFDNFAISLDPDQAHQNDGPDLDFSRRVVVSYKRKYVHVLVNCLFKLAQESVVR